MSAALDALRAGVAELLRAGGDEALAGVVEAAGVELSGSGERWDVGSRKVVAHRVALIVDAADFVGLSGDPVRLDRVRDAFTAAMRSPDTALAHLELVLRLPVIQQGWHHVYRSAPIAPRERPHPEAVREGAARLAAARGDVDAEQILARASVEAGEAPSGLVRYVVRLDPDDLVRVERDRELAERLRWAIERAGTRASAEIGGVVFAV